MHELSIAQNIIEIVIESAEKQNAKRIIEVAVEVGAVSGVVPDALEFAWDMVTKNTIADGAVLKLNIIEPMALCRGCNKEYHLDGTFVCPHCKSSDYELLLGRELKVKSIQVE